MTKREGLSGWQRLGIVTSVLWFVAIPLYVSQYQISEGEKMATFFYSTCRENKFRKPEDCDSDFQKNLVRMRKVDWQPVLFLTLVPIPVWLFSWLVFVIIRWVVRGFQN